MSKEVSFKIKLSDAEQKILEAKIEEVGAPLIAAIDSGRPYEIANFLTKNYHEREVARRIYEAIYKAYFEHEDWVNAHFSLSRLLELYYRDRDQANNYEVSKQICAQMISIESKVRDHMVSDHRYLVESIKERNTKFGLHQKEPAFSFPAHAGYRQLCIIFEKEGRFEDARQLCFDAKLNGWNGDWDNRIERLTKKLEKDSK